MYIHNLSFPLWEKVGLLATHMASLIEPIENYDQTAQMRSPIWVFDWCICIYVYFAGHKIIYF